MVAFREAGRLSWVKVATRTARSTGITPARSPHRTRLGSVGARASRLGSRSLCQEGATLSLAGEGAAFQ